jgi:catechol 2,3-dioxygenase-like lactoylglutathione lyase family enzyme
MSWSDWAVAAIGVERQPFGGLTTATRNSGRAINCFMYLADRSCHFGAFLQGEQLSASKGLGQGTPRYGFFVRPQQLDEHMLRLDRHGITHGDPVDTSEEGVEGTAVYFEDPDGNQYEFFAPAQMPDGAMDVATAAGVGRMSSAVYGARELQRTADFFNTFFGMKPATGPEIPEDTLVLPLASGGRIVYKLVEDADPRTIGHRPWFALHTALTVPDGDFFTNYQALWDGLPEWEDAEHQREVSVDEENELPARTGLHTSPVGRKWKELYSRGDEFYDWDTHAFHLVGGVSKSSDGSLGTYISKDPGDKLQDLVGDYGERPR